MTRQDFENILKIGEHVGVEFKRGGNGAQNDTFETVCAFLNRFGGDIFLGVTDDGKVVGVKEGEIKPIINHIVKTMNNPSLFEPTFAVFPEPIAYKGQNVIRIHVPASSTVHRYRGAKHLNDKFFLENDVRVSLVNKILREVVGNLLIHREYSSSRPARLVIEHGKMFADNANKALHHGAITSAHITGEAIAARLKITRRAVTKQIGALRAMGLVVRVGPKKGGHWEVVEQA